MPLVFTSDGPPVYVHAPPKYPNGQPAPHVSMHCIDSEQYKLEGSSSVWDSSTRSNDFKQGEHQGWPSVLSFYHISVDICMSCRHVIGMCGCLPPKLVDMQTHMYRSVNSLKTSHHTVSYHNQIPLQVFVSPSMAVQCMVKCVISHSNLQLCFDQSQDVILDFHCYLDLS